jgi:3-phosphoshikimate 1-carboxyvinyltransferase
LKRIKLFSRSAFPYTTLRPPSSKSESNRALIINALSDNRSTLNNISSARDTQTLQRLLQSTDHELDVIDAGTTMRFLTAYLSVKNQDKILTGTERMCERPIGILTEALKKIGASISFLNKEGYPPLHIQGMSRQVSNHISIRGDVSSQYISALLMIAPYLPQGLTLELSGKIGSRPYIEMTRELMQTFGVQSQWKGNSIEIAPQEYQPIEYTIETDWSGASYWYSFVALAQEAKIKLLGLKKDSLQGDIRIHEIMRKLGVESTFDSEGVTLEKVAVDLEMEDIAFDFSDVPDLAQTVAVVCAAKGIPVVMHGLESLRIKETDRTFALQIELAKLGTDFRMINEGSWKLSPSADLPKEVEIITYDDHRMAMAFAPLATRMNVIIENPEVVNKSYPSFWKDMETVGFQSSILS